MSSLPSLPSHNRSPIYKRILCVLSKVNGCPTLSQVLEALGIVHEILEHLVLDFLSPSAAVAYGKVCIVRILEELAEIAPLSRTHCEGVLPLVDRLFYTFDETPERSSERLRATMPKNEKINLPLQFFHTEPTKKKKKQAAEIKGKTHRPLPGIPCNRVPANNCDNSDADKEPCKVKMIIQEIVDTERRYVKGLSDLVRVYKEPMENKLAAVSARDVDVIFSSIPGMHSLHAGFLGRLEKGGSKGVQSVAQAFVDYMPRMRDHYVRYGRNFSRALCVIADLRRTVPGFEEFVQTQSKAHFGTAAYDCLGSLLITPIQRLPRYRLLLGELSKFGTSRLLPEAERAVAEIVEAVDNSVEKKGGGDGATEVTATTAVTTATAQPPPPGRKLVRRGDLTLKSWKGVAKQSIHALLFVDTLLLTRKKKLGGQLIVLLNEPLRNCRRVEELPRLSVPQMLADKSAHVGFLLTTVRGTISLDARTREERNEWVCDLRRLIIGARMAHLNARKSY